MGSRGRVHNLSKSFFDKFDKDSLIYYLEFYLLQLQSDNRGYFLETSVERILKRLIVIEGAGKVAKSEEVSIQLMQELIRGGYLPNNKVPEKKIDEINTILTKHIKLRNEIWPNFDLGTQVKKIIEKKQREMGKNLEDQKRLLIKKNKLKSSI